MKRSSCRGCGAPIVWALTHTGARIPLDPRSPVYELGHEYGTDGLPVARVAGERFLVSHFRTCPKADEFSRTRTGGARS